MVSKCFLLLVTTWFCQLSATDFYASPSGAGDDLTLSECLKKLSSGDRCLLREGRYTAGPEMVVLRKPQNCRLEPADGAEGKVVIDGTEELLDLKWAECKEAACKPGVYVADLGTRPDGTLRIFSQLFIGGGDVNKREMLPPGRWPNAQQKNIPKEAKDAPPWASVMDSHKSWSFIDMKASKGRFGKGADGDRGSFVDAGGTNRETEEEIEEGMFEKVVRRGLGALKDAGFSAKGANMIVTYGKGAVEQAVVTKHEAGSNEFEYHHPDCKQGGGYGSCAKGFWKPAFVSYFFENALELIDAPKEWYLERRTAAQGGHRIFLKPPQGTSPKELRLWGRTSGFFLTLDGSTSFTFRGIKTFATSFTTVSGNPNPRLKILDSIFLYPGTGTRLLGNYGSDGVGKMYFHNADKAEFKGNTWAFAEGVALDAKGNDMIMEHNLFEYNGMLSTNGPNTVKWTGSGGTVRRNSLRWNGHVTGWKLMGKGNNITLNHVQHQNWGETLHDGAGIHAQMSAANSEYSKNWIHDGHHSLGIRFDTAKTTVFNKPEDVGHDGLLHHNVLWGKGTKMALKGERHTVQYNTIVGGSALVLVRSFGVQQGMNTLTKASKNAVEIKIAPRGKRWSGPGNVPGITKKGKKEIRPQGVEWELPKGVKGNLEDAELCAELRNCLSWDFRPKKGSKLATMEAGAYSPGLTTYWLPGRQTSQPQLPIPHPSGLGVNSQDASLIFLPAKGCSKHTVCLCPASVQPCVVLRPSFVCKGTSKILEGDANIWELENLKEGARYVWQVFPNDCAGAQASPEWSFETASTTAGGDQQKEQKQEVQEEKKEEVPQEKESNEKEQQAGATCVDTKSAPWCKKKKAQGKCNQQRAKCKKTCGFCPDATTTTTTTKTTDAACTDTKPRGWCKRKKNAGQCKTVAQVKAKCRKTCEICSSSLVTAKVAPLRVTASSKRTNGMVKKSLLQTGGRSVKARAHDTTSSVGIQMMQLSSQVHRRTDL